MKLEENKQYLLEINDKSCKAELIKIQTYSASGMPNDYLFTALEGEEPLLSQEKGYFPIPQFMISMMSITPLEDGEPVSKEVLDNQAFLSKLEELNNIPLMGDTEHIFRSLDKFKPFTDDQKTIFKTTVEARMDSLKATY